jgi:TolA-binding protein
MNREVYDAVTLSHLRAALASTSATDPTRPDLLVQVARVATLVGDLALARQSYEAFLRDYPRERRAYTVTQAIAHLGGPFPP